MKIDNILRPVTNGPDGMEVVVTVSGVTMDEYETIKSIYEKQLDVVIEGGLVIKKMIARDNAAQVKNIKDLAYPKEQ